MFLFAFGGQIFPLQASATDQGEPGPQTLARAMGCNPDCHYKALGGKTPYRAGTANPKVQSCLAKLSIIVVLVLLLGGGGFYFKRRR